MISGEKAGVSGTDEMNYVIYILFVSSLDKV